MIGSKTKFILGFAAGAVVAMAGTLVIVTQYDTPFSGPESLPVDAAMSELFGHSGSCTDGDTRVQTCSDSSWEPFAADNMRSLKACRRVCRDVDYTKNRVSKWGGWDTRWCEPEECLDACYDGCKHAQSYASASDCEKEVCLFHTWWADNLGDGAYHDCSQGCHYRFGAPIEEVVDTQPESCLAEAECRKECDLTDFEGEGHTGLGSRDCEVDQCKAACYEGCESECSEGYEKCRTDVCLYHTWYADSLGDGLFYDCERGCNIRHHHSTH